MKRKKGFTLIELLVVIAIIAMLLAILMPALNKVKKIAQRVICGTNLKGLGTAQNVYANDYEDQFAKQGGVMTLNLRQNTQNWPDPAVGWETPGTREITNGASLYLLVREADVSPKSFVCTAGGQSAFDGRNPTNVDLVELWDFGNDNWGGGPDQAVSYAYQDPYGRHSASGSATASFAMMADKNPYFDPKLTWEQVNWSSPDATLADRWSSLILRLPPYWDGGYERWTIQSANSYPHGREGQNVLFGDGHNAFEKASDCGVRNDNIYTRQNAQAGIQGIRCGLTSQDNYYVTSVCLVAGVNAGNPPPGLEPESGDDSVLVNDDYAK